MPSPGGGKAAGERAKERRQSPGATKSSLVFPIPLPFCTGPSLLRVFPEREPPWDRGWGVGRGQGWVIKFRCPANYGNLTLTVHRGQALGAAVRSAPRTAH